MTPHSPVLQRGRPASLEALLCHPWTDKFFGILLIVVHSEKVLGTFRARSLDVAAAAYAVNFVILGLIVLTRRPARRFSMDPIAWLLGVLSSATGIGIGFFHVAGESRIAPVPLIQVLALAGMFLTIWSRLSLGRSFALLPADRGVVARGAYRLVRHPIYSSGFVASVAVVLSRFSLPILALDLLAIVLVVIRAGQEERFLATDPDYQAYCQRVRYRFIPFIY